MTEFNFGKVFSRIGYVYVILPFCIFLIGWCKWYVWIPGMIIVIGCFISLLKNAKIDFTVPVSKKLIITILIIALIIGVWVVLSGIGKITYQSVDHQWRNKIFEMLVEHDWPVVSGETGNNLILVYYIAFWLVPAALGKIFGVAAGYIFQTIWAFLGTVIAYGLICVHLKKIKIWPLILFICFSGLDIIGWLIEKRSFADLTWGTHLEWWSPFQYSSFTTQLFWVFNQAVFAWIIFMLIKLQKTNRLRIFILAFAALSSPFAFIGMLPFIVYWIFKEHIDEKRKVKWKELFKGLITIENILGGGFVGILSYLYLKNNISGNIVGRSSYYESKYFVIHLLIFVVIEYLLFCAGLYKTQKRNPLFYISAISLFIIPWISIGSSNDFCMRASIPALMVLYLLVADTLQKSKAAKKRGAMIALICMLAIGAATPFQEVTRALIHSPQENTTVSESEVWENKNFIGLKDQGIFNKYLAK